MSLWHKSTQALEVDWDYPGDGYVSERVIVDWQWANTKNREKEEDLRFARYYWGNNAHWSIDGITGNAIILRWFNPNDVK